MTDIECVVIARTLGVKTENLLPELDNSQSLFFVLSQLTGGQLKRLMPPDEILADRSAKLLNGHKILSRNLDNAQPPKAQIAA